VSNAAAGRRGAVDYAANLKRIVRPNAMATRVSVASVTEVSSGSSSRCTTARAAMQAVGPAGDVATELLSAEQLAKVAGWMRRNLHWKDSDDVIVRDEQR
jgi:hypothetical protein